MSLDQPVHEPRPAAPPIAARRREVDAPRALRASPFPAAAGVALFAAARLAVMRWDRALARVEDVQRKTLASILRAAAKTEYGRAHGFGDVARYEDFVRRVPVGDYDAFSPFIDRMRRGEKDVLVPGAIRYYGNSSGSSNQGRPKFLPIGEVQIAHQRRAGADALMRYLAWAKDDTFPTGFTLGLFPPTTMKAEGPSLVTSNPALMVTRMPLFTRPMYLPHEPIKQIADYDEKLTKIAERYLDYDVRAVAGTTCWFPLMFEKVLEVAARRGRRARDVRDVWPNLRVMLGGGVSAEPYVPVLRRLFGRDDVTLVDTYNATEGGIYGSSDFSGKPGMLMLPHRGTFFEFVPMDERGNNARRVPLWAVEKDRPYAIVVTTTSGLYAYELGDIVRFPSVAPHRIEFMGRLSGCLSLTQELMTHVEIERAVARAVTDAKCRTVDFGAAADVDVEGSAKSRYVLFVEFDDGAAPSDLGAFAASFDAGLCEQNRVYREHRAGEVALLPPRVVVLPRGAAKRFLDEITGGNVQGKFPRILDESRKVKLLHIARQAS